MAAPTRAATDPADDQPDPGVDLVGHQQKRGGISPDAEKGHLAEREHPCIATHDIPGHPHHAEHEKKDHDVLWKGICDEERKNESERSRRPIRCKIFFKCKLLHGYHPKSPWGLIQTVMR